MSKRKVTVKTTLCCRDGFETFNSSNKCATAITSIKRLEKKKCMYKCQVM